MEQRGLLGTGKRKSSTTEDETNWLSGRTPPWVMLMIMIMLVIIAILVLALVVVVSIMYAWGSSQIRSFQQFADKNKIVPRFVKAMEFTERIIDNPMGYLFGDRTDSKTREDYMSTVQRASEMIRQLSDRKIIEHTDELEQEMLALVRRLGGNLFLGGGGGGAAP